MWRVMAIRAASICRLVIHEGSVATRPKSPNEIMLPCVEGPFIRPRIILRRPSLTLLGISIGGHLLGCGNLGRWNRCRSGCRSRLRRAGGECAWRFLSRFGAVAYARSRDLVFQ